MFIRVGLKGKSALLMHRFPLEPIVAFDKKTPSEQAEISAYRLAPSKKFDLGELYIPGVNIQRGMVAAAKFSKGKGRASLEKLAAACVIVSDEHVGLGVQEYSIDSRAVVVPATGGRIVRHRPRLDSWSIEFVFEFDETLIRQTEMRKILDDMGSRVGLGDFRPECKGPFGRFDVVLWDDE